MAGIVLGLLVGLMVALGVAMYVTKAPMPFASKSSTPTPAAPAPLNGAAGDQPPPDPNTLLLPKEVRDFIQAPNIQATTPGANRPVGRTEAPAAESPASPPGAAAAPVTLFFLETGRFKSAEDAEQMRVRLVLASVEANVVEVLTDSGSPYRVRVGPYASAEDAYRARTRITENGFEARLVKVSK